MQSGAEGTEINPVQSTDIHIHAAFNQTARVILAVCVGVVIVGDVTQRERADKKPFTYMLQPTARSYYLRSDMGEESKQPLPAPSTDNKHAHPWGQKNRAGAD